MSLSLFEEPLRQKQRFQGVNSEEIDKDQSQSRPVGNTEYLLFSTLFSLTDVI